MSLATGELLQTGMAATAALAQTMTPTMHGTGAAATAIHIGGVQVTIHGANVQDTPATVRELHNATLRAVTQAVDRVRNKLDGHRRT